MNLWILGAQFITFPVPHTPSTTHLTAWFCQDPLFFGRVAVLLWLHFRIPVCVCVRLFTPCVQVYLRLWQPPNTTQYGPQTVVPLPGQLASFDVLRKLATWFSWHDTTDTIDNTTQLGHESAAVQWRLFLRTARSDPQHLEELWWKTCFSGTQAPRVVRMDASTHLNSENR